MADPSYLLRYATEMEIRVSKFGNSKNVKDVKFPDTLDNVKKLKFHALSAKNLSVISIPSAPKLEELDIDVSLSKVTAVKFPDALDKLKKLKLHGDPSNVAWPRKDLLAFSAAHFVPFFVSHPRAR